MTKIKKITMTQEEKDKIDYELKSKSDHRAKDAAEWGCALFLAMIVCMFMMVALSTCQS